MSKAETTPSTEDTFATKLGIEMTTTRVYADLIEHTAGLHAVVCAVGKSGIGKTAIPKQVAARRNGGKGVPYLGLHVPTMTMEDFHIPTMAEDDKRYFDRRIPRRFQALLNWVADVKRAHKGVVPPDLVPILAIEELNRAVDKSVTRAVFVLIDDRMIGDVQLDDSIQIVVTMNPTGGGMAVNEFEKDPAMRRRLMPIGVSFNYGDFMQYAQASKFHPDVIDHLGAQPSAAYDELNADAGKVFACPATWDLVSQTCKRFAEKKIPLLSTVGRSAISGLIGTAASTLFLDFVKDHTLVVTPEDVLTSYGTDPEVSRRFKSYLTEGGGRLDKVTDLTTGVVAKLFADLKRVSKPMARPVACFLNDLPVEIMMAFIQRLTEGSNQLGTEAKDYLTKFNVELAQEPAFNEALKRLNDAKLAIEQETGAKGD